MTTHTEGPGSVAQHEAFVVLNPATGEVVGQAPQVDAKQVAQAVARAREAQPAWAEAGFERRAAVLERMSRWVIQNSDRIIESIVAESGKPSDEAVLSEIGHPAHALRYWAEKAPELLADEEIEPTSPLLAGKRLMVRHAPVGVVGVIGPWNFPFTNSVCDCIPALAAGNAVVLKPSEVTPLTSILIADGFQECGMPGAVLQVLTGDGRTGEALIDEVDYVVFTGSVATGGRVMARAAETLTPVALELGGKDPMIVLADADLERATNGAVWFGLRNAGQVCTSIERIYVEEPVYDQFVTRVVDKVKALRQGCSAGFGSIDVGPMIYPPQAEIVARQLADALAKGARALVGGQIEEWDGGRYVRPTVLVDVDHTMAVMREETFGPVLPIMRVRDAEEAIVLANDSSYGLGASVFTGDVARGRAIARRLESGAVCINDASVNFLALELPMGGWKSSGVGSRHGPDGIRKFTRPQALVVTDGAPGREQYMYPYSAEATTQIRATLQRAFGEARGG